MGPSPWFRDTRQLVWAVGCPGSRRVGSISWDKPGEVIDPGLWEQVSAAFPAVNAAIDQHLAAGGLAAVQEDVRQLEATARTLRNFQPGIVPGLLQTALAGSERE